MIADSTCFAVKQKQLDQDTNSGYVRLFVHMSANDFWKLNQWPMKELRRPTCCGVRGCLGSVEVKELKGVKILQCDTQVHHKAWMVQTESGIEWQFHTRGRTSIKGVVVESEPEQKNVPEQNSRTFSQWQLCPLQVLGLLFLPFASWQAAKVDEHVGAPGPQPLTDKQEELAPTSPVEKSPQEAHHQAEITVPSDDAEIAVPNHEPEIAQPSPTVSSPQTSAKPSHMNASPEAVSGIDSENTPPKRTFLEKKRLRQEDASQSSSEKKAKSSASKDSPMPSSEKKSPSDNVKRDSCEICLKPRGHLQRGAACPQCL